MSMKYKTKCICQIDPEYLKRSGQLICIWCHGSGETEYDLHLQDYIGKFDDEVRFWAENEGDETDAKILYDEYECRLNCSCGDEVYLTNDEKTVCSCGRIYLMIVDIMKDDSHKGDMEYWDKIKKEKYG